MEREFWQIGATLFLGFIIGSFVAWILDFNQLETFIVAYLGVISAIGITVSIFKDK